MSTAPARPLQAAFIPSQNPKIRRLEVERDVALACADIEIEDAAKHATMADGDPDITDHSRIKAATQRAIRFRTTAAWCQSQIDRLSGDSHE
jgi:hypothetical protein